MTGFGQFGLKGGQPLWLKNGTETYVITADRLPAHGRRWKRPYAPEMSAVPKLDFQTRNAERRARDEASARQAREDKRRQDEEERKIKKRAQESERRHRQATERMRNKRARQQVDAMLEQHRSLGRSWMAERGPFGLSGGLRPIAKYGGKLLSKYIAAAGYLVGPAAPVLSAGAIIGEHHMDRAVAEIEKYEVFLASEARKRSGELEYRTSPEAASPNACPETVGHYEITMRGGLSVQDKVVQKIAERFATRLAQVAKANPDWTRSQVSTRAHALVQTVDLPRIGRRFSIPAKQIAVEPCSGMTGRGGGQVRFDVALFQRRAALIELKSSGYDSSRSRWQLRAQQLATRERTASYGRPSSFYLIQADERRILKWTEQDLRQKQFKIKRGPRSPRRRLR